MVRYSQPRPTGGAIELIESKRVGAGAHRLEAGLQPDPLLGGAGAGEVGVVLVLLHLQQVRRGVVDGGARRAAGSVQSMSSAAFSAVGTSSGFTSYAETQVTSSWTGSGASSTGRRGHLGGDPRDRHRGLGDPHRLVGREHHARGEAPGAAVDDADREAEVLGVAGALQHAVAHAEVLVADPLEAEVRVAGAELARPLQRGVAERAVGQGGEGRVETGGRGSAHAAEPIRCRGPPSGPVRTARGQARARTAHAEARTVNGAGPRAAAQRSRSRDSRAASSSPATYVPERADAEGVRRPPLLEARERRLDGQLGLLDLAQPGRGEELDQVPARAPRAARASSTASGSSAATASQQVLSGLRPPAWSHTQAATTPPGAVTRAISRTPATGSLMKWTTSWASAASKASSGWGSSSAVPRRTSAPGRRACSAATNGGDGSIGRDGASPTRRTSSALSAPGPPRRPAPAARRRTPPRSAKPEARGRRRSAP